MTDIECIFRSNVRQENGCEFATCELIRRFADLPDQLCSVERDLCLACARAPIQEAVFNSPVLASLLYQRCERYVSDAASDGRQRSPVAALLERAEQALVDQQERIWAGRPLVTCDVVLCCADGSAAAREAIESVLRQEAAIPILHLVDVGNAADLCQRYNTLWNVHLHEAAPGTTPLGAVHDLVEKLQTPFVAVQRANSTSHPRRLVDSVSKLVAEGAELFLAAARTHRGIYDAELPGRAYRRYAPAATLVVRKASFIDLGGAADRADDDVEFVYRAACESRPIVIGSQPTVTFPGEIEEPPVGSPPDYQPSGLTPLRQHGRGFRQQRVACDVVLPFRGHLDYVTQAIESLLSQEGADVIVHLVDDATPDDTNEFLSRWKSHSNVRAYRNKENIGQYTSFNNVSRRFETDLAAVQDADDISLPHRIATGGNLLRLSGADFFGGAVRLFGTTSAVKPARSQTDQQSSAPRRTHRWSYYPPADCEVYFLENPTAMFRVNMFRGTNGYTDFGDPLANRASLDTELLLRCLYSGVHFAITREVVTRYRVHEESATQNSTTGWGTAARTKAVEQVEFRAKVFRTTQKFDPRVFGALGRYDHLTERI